jgi:iron complex outermembrane receptor protein
MHNAGSKRLRFVTGALLALECSSPAAAQRSNENAVRAADDAFGTSVGSERVGLYSAGSARGFSPIQAGNVRIEGLYFDYQADLQERLVSGSTIRVGLSAQSYPFPAPTGIADYSLRKAGDEAVLSGVVGYGPFGGLRVELDGQAPVTDTLSVAAGVGMNSEEMFYGASRKVLTAAVIPRWRPRRNIEIIPFWSLTDVRSQEPQPILFTAGPFLPPRIRRREYFGLPWAEGSSRGVNYGIVSTVGLSDSWTIRAGLFRSLLEFPTSFSDLSLNTSADGFADRYLIADADRSFGSTSGEIRISRRIDEGDRRHIIHLAGRGREQRRRFGGGQSLFLGRARIDERLDVPEREFTYGPQTRESVRQLTAGIGYEGRWRRRGELSFGLQKTSYSKEALRPAGPAVTSKSSPILMNGTLSVYATPHLVLYAGYAKGLEETAVAPEIARNKDEAPPASITRQMDAGLRYAISDRLRVIAGLFDVRKPYYALDESLLFSRLGTVRHRGVELSLSGQLGSRINIVAGTVFLDARLSGEAVDRGLVGKRPVNATGRFSSAAIEYRTPWVEGLSFDLAYESTSKRTANRQNTVFVPARYVISPGMRYRFTIDGTPASIRAQIASINNVYGYNIFGEGVYYNFPRRFTLALTADL